nr:uncharacterized protein LOC106043975 [Anser cygnoides]
MKSNSATGTRWHLGSPSGLGCNLSPGDVWPFTAQTKPICTATVQPRFQKAAAEKEASYQVATLKRTSYKISPLFKLNDVARKISPTENRDDLECGTEWDMTMQKRAGDDCSFGCPLSVTEMQPADRGEFHQEKACYLRSGTEGRVVTVNEMDPCSWIPAVSQAACSAGGCSCAPLKPQCLPCHCCDHSCRQPRASLPYKRPCSNLLSAVTFRGEHTTYERRRCCVRAHLVYQSLCQSSWHSVSRERNWLCLQVSLQIKNPLY